MAKKISRNLSVRTECYKNFVCSKWMSQKSLSVQSGCHKKVCLLEVDVTKIFVCSNWMSQKCLSVWTECHKNVCLLEVNVTKKFVCSKWMSQIQKTFLFLRQMATVGPRSLLSCRHNIMYIISLRRKKNGKRNIITSRRLMFIFSSFFTTTWRSPYTPSPAVHH